MLSHFVRCELGIYGLLCACVCVCAHIARVNSVLVESSFTETHLLLLCLKYTIFFVMCKMYIKWLIKMKENTRNQIVCVYGDETKCRMMS